ncbi:MAG: tRNA (adenosine(37)-N6)-threonylcarbamoyltransferase complex transferase subunit TsaD [Simkaniaceae bacterium]|nr:tRNA (adenosine(37)-N6)-threonylcarbamoyltransferase complex transferase subunit TsaD [Simkaniaceae bacterium]
MKVLGIETSCDETAVSIVEDGKRILINLVASQVEIHKAFGGVFPEMASRAHIDRLLPLIEEATKSHEIDLIAVANGPGLLGALLMGVTAAKTLAYGWNKPLVDVNHVEAHIYAAMMDVEPIFPSLGIVVSGGHTFLAKLTGVCAYAVLGTTVDDAVGEAFDKVASLLGLPYPGGPEIERVAKSGDPAKYPFKSGQVKKRPLDFSFSGLKTSVLYQVKGTNCGRKEPTIIEKSEKKHLAAGFQKAALEDILNKALKAAKTFDCKGIYLGGGVTQNGELRRLFKKSPYPVFWPPRGLSLDNAAMIAGLGYHLYQRKDFSNDVQPFPRTPL